jgi:putative ABC transport system substrate-binding protein
MNGFRRKHLSTFAGAVLALLCLAGSAYGDIRIAVLMTDSLTATMRTLHGATKIITNKHPEASLHTFLIGQRPEGLHRVIDSVKAIGPTVVLTIGSPATKCAQENFTDIPIVFAAVKYPELSGFIESAARPGKNITGASIDVPTSVQFTYFKRIVPSLKRIGILYSDSTAALIPAARAEATSLGLTLLSIKVADAKDLPKAMDSLAGSVDGIWSLADPNLFDPQSTRYILLNTLRKGIPFMGFSRNVVESGALFALDFDYKAVGQQAGEIVNRIINGEKPEDIRVTSADVIWFHYNEKTAQHINVKIPEELAAVAKEVYR